jgi:hypothetical protein
MTRPVTCGAILTATVEAVPYDRDNPRSGQYIAQARWEEDTHTAYAATPLGALCALACALNRETWPDDTATARVLDPERRIWPA